MIQIVIVAAYEAVTRTSRRLSKRRALNSGFSKEAYKALDRDVMGRAYDPSSREAGKKRRLSRNEEKAWMAFLAKEREERRREAEWRREGERLPNYGENVRVVVAEERGDEDEDAEGRAVESDDELQSLGEVRRAHRDQQGGLDLGRRHTVGSTPAVFPHLRVTEREICWAGSPAYEEAVGEELHSVTSGRTEEANAAGSSSSQTNDSTNTYAPRRSAPLYLPPPPGKTMADLRRTTSGCA